MDYMSPNQYGYGPYYTPPKMMKQKENVPVVNGRGALDNYDMAPDSSKIFMDQAGFIWVVTTDGVGYKTIKAYDVTPRNENPIPTQATAVDMSSVASYAEKLNEYTAALDARITRLEGIVNGDSGTAGGQQEQYPTVTTTTK